MSLDLADIHGFISESPFASDLRISCRRTNGSLLAVLPSRPEFMGNPLLKAFHGGVIGGFLEYAAELALYDAVGRLGGVRLVNLTLDYQRSAKAELDLLARASLVKVGAKLSSVHMTAFQEPGNRIATVAIAHFSMPGADRRLYAAPP